MTATPSDSYHYDVFISYRQQEPDLSWVRTTLLRYSSRAWAAAYDDGQEPDNVNAFYRDVWWLAERVFRPKQSAARQLSNDEALSYFRDQPA